jgi:hypothetical protein
MSGRRPENEAELLELIRSIDVRAPEELHRRTEAMIAQGTGHTEGSPRGPHILTGPRGRLALGSALAAAAAAALILLLVLAGGGSTPLGLHDAAALTLRGATMGAPAESPHSRTELTASVDGIAFPYWEERFGWRSSGSRTDRLGGRTIRTVFYRDPAQRQVGYSIVAGTPAPTLGGGVVEWRQGTPYHLLREGSGEVVAWLREGHLCVVGGRGVSSATLLRLASWEQPPART